MRAILQKVELPDKRELLIMSTANPRLYQRQKDARWQRVSCFEATRIKIPRDALVSQWPGKETA